MKRLSKRRRCGRVAACRGGRRWRRQGAEFLDPMCGSGTFVIEAAPDAAEHGAGAGAGGTSDSWGGVSTTRRSGSACGVQAERAVRFADDSVARSSGGRIEGRRCRARGARECATRGVGGLVRFAVQPLSEAPPTRVRADLAGAGHEWLRRCPLKNPACKLTRCRTTSSMPSPTPEATAPTGGGGSSPCLEWVALRESAVWHAAGGSEGGARDSSGAG